VRRARIVLICALAFSVVGVPASAEAQNPQGDLLGKVNKVRTKSGLRPLRTSPSLVASSSRFSGSLMSGDRFGHAPRVSAVHQFKQVGEALSIHFGHKPRTSTVVRGWLASSSHRAILLKTGVNWMGAGMTKGRFRGRKATIWVLQVGKR
jgi:uncharacterized protein YkwD